MKLSGQITEAEYNKRVAVLDDEYMHEIKSISDDSTGNSLRH